MLGGGADKQEHTENTTNRSTHTHAQLHAAGHARECTVGHRHTYTASNPAQTDLCSLQLSNPAVKQNWKTMQGLHSHLSKERCFSYAKWFAQQGMTFLPPLRIHASFFSLCYVLESQQPPGK